MKATDLVKGDWVQVNKNGRWVISRVHYIGKNSLGRDSISFYGETDSLKFPFIHLPIRGISSKIRPVTEEMRAKMNLLLDQARQAQERLDAIKKEWEEFVQ